MSLCKILCQRNSNVFLQVLVPEFKCRFSVNAWMPVLEFTCLCASLYARVHMPVLCERVNASVGIHMSLCKFLCQSSYASFVWMGECQCWNSPLFMQVLMPEFRWQFRVNASAGIHMALCKFLCQSSFSFPELWCVKRIHSYSPLVQFAFSDSSMLNYCTWQSCHPVSCFIQKGSVYYLRFIYSVSCLFLLLCIYRATDAIDYLCLVDQSVKGIICACPLSSLSELLINATPIPAQHRRLQACWGWWLMKCMAIRFWVCLAAEVLVSDLSLMQQGILTSHF